MSYRKSLFSISVKDSSSLFRNENVPWVTYIFLAVVFFIAEHDLFFSLRETFISPTEIIISKAHGGDPLRRVVFSMLGLFGVVGLLRGGLNRLTFNGGLGWIILIYSMR